jgi:hypothetical protein
MARIVFEENYHVYLLDTPPANPAAPTMTEIAAGDDITAFIPKDGFAPGVSNNRVPAGDLSTAFDAEIMGSHGAQLQVTSFMDDQDLGNLTFDAFGVRGFTGAFVACWRGAAATDEPCFVWPYVESGSPMLPTTAANERQSFTAEFAVGGDGTEPDYHAVVAAGA